MADEVNCIQQQTIGELKASLQTRKEESQEIKGKLDALVTMLTTSHMEQTKRDGDLRNELTKIATVLTNEQERRAVFEKQQEQQNTTISEMRTEILKLNNTFETFSGTLKESSSVHHTFENRIRRLERYSYVIYGIILAVIAIGSILGYFFTVMSGMKDMMKQESSNERTVERVEDHSTSTTTTTSTNIKNK